MEATPSVSTRGRQSVEFGTQPLWRWLDDLRAHGGTASPLSDLIAPLAGLLVLRWAAFIDAEQEAVAAFDDTPFVPILPEQLRQQAWKAGIDIAAALANITAEAHDNAAAKYARTVAPLVHRCAQADRRCFEELVAWVASCDFESADGREQVAKTFERLLTQVVEAQGKFGGEFTTPESVVDLMIELAAPKLGDRVYDPCFGIGGLLVAAGRRLKSAVATGCPQTRGQVRNQGVFGVERNAACFAIGLCRIVLGGIDQPGLELGDTLERPFPRNRAVEGFDCIVASPPWGGRIADARARQFPVPTGSIETLFLQHIMANLRPGGRAVVALTEGALFRTGADRQVRKTLLSEFRVEGVVSLPEGAFAPFTNIASSLVVFRREEPRDSIRFVRARLPRTPIGEGRGPDEPATIARLLHEDLTRVTPEWVDPTGFVAPPVDGWAWDVSVRTLVARDYELLAKRTGSEQLKSALDRLQAVDPTLQVLPLEQIADVFQGVSYERRLTTEKRSGQALAPLVRVGDVVDPQLKAPTLFFAAGAKNRVSEDQLLRGGDILLTTSGSVGKVGIVGDSVDLRGALATKSLVVIRCRREDATPAFLAALLRSPCYQDWLSGHARGSTIQHMSVRTLRKLLLPLPEVPVQGATLRQLGAGGDALAVLRRTLSGGTSDPIAAWLEKPTVVELLSERTAPAAEPVEVLAMFGRDLQELASSRNSIAHTTDTDLPQDAQLWLMEAVSLGGILDGIDTVPEGAARLAALELARSRTEGARRVFDSSQNPQGARLRALSSALLLLLEQASSRMLSRVSIVVTAEPREVVVGVPTEVQLQLRNESPAGLRSLRVTTRPDVGGGATTFLAEGAAASFSLTIHASDATRPLGIDVRWQAARLDGKPLNGEAVVELLVRSTREAVIAGELGASPYIVGNPVDREEMFFGRQDVFERIRRQLGSTTNANVILLEGNRRTGKTSILRQLQKKEALLGWVPIYCSFQDAEGNENCAGISTRNIYRLLARAVGWSLYDAGIRTWFPGEPAPDTKRPFKLEFRAALDRVFRNEHPFETFEMYLQAALEAVRPQRLLLMLDEFDKLQDGIDSGITSPQVPENIRHLLQHQQGLSAILTGSRRLKRMREEYWSVLFGLGYPVSVSALPLEDAPRLVTEPVDGRLAYLPQARDRVVEFCARQPFLIQSLCNRIFESAAASNERTITLATVEDAAAAMVRNNEHFRTLWDYAKTHRRRLVLALCERLAEGPDAVNLELLLAKLEMLGVRVARKSMLGDDIDELRELELIDFDRSYRGGTYRVAVPLLALWLKTAIDFDDAVARAREESQEAHA